MGEKVKKTRFFKRLGYSITKLEKYPDMAAEGLRKSLGYLVKLVMIITLVISIGTLYQTHSLIQKCIRSVERDFPDFQYKDGILSVSSESEIRIDADKVPLGKVIIDTNTEEEQKINQYIEEITKEEQGIIILKSRLIIKNARIVGTISYNYKETFEQMGINEFDKQELLAYVDGSGLLRLYTSTFFTVFIYSFIMYFLTTISNVVLLSIFGLIATLLAKIKMRYVAIFNMSIYSITLSVILNTIYIGVNIFMPFNMEYFQVMYVAVAAIYLVAAILILKSDFIKKQAELEKITETEKMIKQEQEEKEENKEEKEENKEEKEEEQEEKEENKEEKKEEQEEKKEEKKKRKNKKEKEKETKKDNSESEKEDNIDLEDEPEGSNA